YPSAALGRSIALALIEGGRERHGERVHVPLPLAGRGGDAVVRDPRFLDPEGLRLDG
ncbi:MAG: hypothetical protein O7A68_13860, partial [Alphaproteobacteria bacterium]|nr:hypothetical protein [Alphaproteobacteria bacterium]